MDCSRYGLGLAHSARHDSGELDRSLTPMQLRFYKRVFITPFIRLNFTNGGLSISFGHRRLGWLTLSHRGIRWTIDTPLLGRYATDSVRWKDLQK